MWTQFMDMHSGGYRKLDWEYIYIEAPIKEAKAIFYNKFGRNPERVTCSCCGEDYSINESETLEGATAYNRGLRQVENNGLNYNDKNKWKYLEPTEEIPEGYKLSGYSRGIGITLDEYLENSDVKFIYKKDISSSERIGRIPREGYVWLD